MGRGKKVLTDTKPEDWTPILPSSNMQTHWKFACRERLAYENSNVTAEWILIDENPDRGTSTYADSSTIRRTGNKVKMMVLYDYETVQRTESTQSMSRMLQHEFDCKGERLRLLYAFFYSENMGRGKLNVTFDFDVPAKWIPFPPNSIYSALLKFACGQGDTK